MTIAPRSTQSFCFAVTCLWLVLGTCARAESAAPAEAFRHFDHAVALLASDAQAASESARAAAIAFEASAEQSEQHSGEHAMNLYNAGTAWILAKEPARAILRLREAEQATPAWSFGLRRNILTNLQKAREDARTSLAQHDLSSPLASPDPDRDWRMQVGVLVPLAAWCLVGGVVAGIGSILGIVRVLRAGSRPAAASITLMAIGGLVIGTGVVTDTSHDSARHAVVTSPDALPRSKPDELLGEAMTAACPAGTELRVVSILKRHEPGDPRWVRVRRLGDPEGVEFWLPHSGIDWVRR